MRSFLPFLHAVAKISGEEKPMDDRLNRTRNTCPTADAVIVVIRNHNSRRRIVEGFQELGDTVIDWYAEFWGQQVSSMFDIPHRLVVLGYRDYKRNETAILLNLSQKKPSAPPILIFGHRWKRIPIVPGIIDGDHTTPEEICRLFWEAREGK